MSLINKIYERNPNLKQLESDYLYHLGIKVSNTKDDKEIQRRFGSIKFVCLGGTKGRMKALATHLLDIVEVEDESERELRDLSEVGQRYSMYKVGPVLCCSHGIGMASMSVLLHEVIKLCMYAKCVDPIFLRIGTSGGLGVKPGTVVVTKDVFNGLLKTEHRIAILGESHVRPAKFDADVVNKLISCSAADDHFDIVCGNTLSAECFYEGQGRIDGAICHYTNDDKMRFLRHCCNDFGIRNMEMESTLFSSLTLHLGIKAATVCVTFLDRLLGDQVTISLEEKAEFEKRPLIIMGRFIQQELKYACTKQSNHIL